jgi:hypothetical protein
MIEPSGAGSIIVKPAGSKSEMGEKSAGTRAQRAAWLTRKKER